MLRVTSKTGKKKPGRVKYPHIVRAAADLGVSRTHLYLVLEKKRSSRSLELRYRELMGARGAGK